MKINQQPNHTNLKNKKKTNKILDALEKSLFINNDFYKKVLAFSNNQLLGKNHLGAHLCNLKVMLDTIAELKNEISTNPSLITDSNDVQHFDFHEIAKNLYQIFDKIESNYNLLPADFNPINIDSHQEKLLKSIQTLKNLKRTSLNPWSNYEA